MVFMDEVSENKFLTVNQLWQDFGIDNVLPELSIFDVKKEDNLQQKFFYFTAYKSLSGRIRVYAKAYIPETPKGAVLYINDVKAKSFNDKIMKSLAQEGYYVFCCDTYGVKEGTSYEGEYSCFSGDANNIEVATPSCRSNPIFIWSGIVRRLIDVTENERNKLNLAIVAEGLGCVVAWQVAATDSRVQALALVNGGYFDIEKKEIDADNDGELDIDSNWERWQAAISPKAYTKNVAIPVFCAPCTNSREYNFDKLNKALSFFKGELTYSVSPLLENQIFSKSYVALLRWLNNKLNKKVKPISFALPALGISIVDRQIKLTLEIDSSKAKSVTLCYSFNQPRAEYRNWHFLTMTKTEGGYEATLSGYCEDKLLLCFANLTHKDGFTLSTPTLFTELTADDVALKPKPPMFLLYDTSAKRGNFSHQTEGLVLDEDNMYVAEDAIGIWGLGIKTGKLFNYKIGEVSLHSEVEDRILQFSLFTATDVSFSLSMFKLDDNDKEICFSATKEISGSTAWQKVTFACQDFKNGNLLPMKNWLNLTKAEIMCAEGVIINNVLWI